MKKLYLILIITICTLQLSAQNKITLTWQVDDVNIPKDVVCLTDGVLTINWGDGMVETINDATYIIYHNYETQGKYDVTITAANSATKFDYFICEDKQVSKLDFFECTDLVSIVCDYNQLKDLYLSNCPNLELLNCDYNQINNLDLSNCVSLTTISCVNNQIVTLNISNCTSLTQLYFNGNQISNINLSNCMALDYLSCFDNKLTDLDISNCNVLHFLSCSNNQLKLSTLYAAQLKISNVYDFGKQYLSTISANTNTELFKDQSMFDGIFTKYTVEIDGEPAPTSDYTVTEGKLILHTLGKYNITMSNDAIGTELDFAQVIIPIETTPVNVKETTNLYIEVYPNPTRGEMQITSYELQVTSIEIFDIYGNNIKTHTSNLLSQISFNISNFSAGVYFIRINTSEGEVVKKVVKI